MENKTKIIIGASLLGIGAITMVSSFFVVKSEYGTPEYREQQPRGMKRILIGGAIALVGGIVLGENMKSLKNKN